MKPDLSVQLGPLSLKNPILTASGTAGMGEEAAPGLLRLADLGAFVAKTVTERPRRGNPPPRVAETSGGMLNSIGLENKGLEYFRERLYPRLAELGTKVIASISAESAEGFGRMTATLDALPRIDAIELNISCPNLRGGGAIFAHDPAMTADAVRAARAATRRPLIAKLSPSVTDVVPIAKAAAAEGADALTVANTYSGLAVDWERRRPVLGGVTGGLSGPAVKPLILRLVWIVARSVRLPVIASGGAATARDVLEYLVAGASAVQVGTAAFVEPGAAARILAELEAALAARGVERVSSLTGTLEVPGSGTAEGG